MPWGSGSTCSRNRDSPYNPTMRGCAAVLIILLSLSFLDAPAFSQCNYSLVASVPFRATVYDVFIDGNDLWVATGYGVALYDRSVDPPRLPAVVGVPQTTQVRPAAHGPPESPRRAPHPPL